MINEDEEEYSPIGDLIKEMNMQMNHLGYCYSLEEWEKTINSFKYDLEHHDFRNLRSYIEYFYCSSVDIPYEQIFNTLIPNLLMERINEIVDIQYEQLSILCNNILANKNIDTKEENEDLVLLLTIVELLSKYSISSTFFNQEFFCQNLLRILIQSHESLIRLALKIIYRLTFQSKELALDFELHMDLSGIFLSLLKRSHSSTFLKSFIPFMKFNNSQDLLNYFFSIFGKVKDGSFDVVIEGILVYYQHHETEFPRFLLVSSYAINHGNRKAVKNAVSLVIEIMNRGVIEDSILAFVEQILEKMIYLISASDEDCYQMIILIHALLHFLPSFQEFISQNSIFEAIGNDFDSHTKEVKVSMTRLIGEIMLESDSAFVSYSLSSINLDQIIIAASGLCHDEMIIFFKGLDRLVNSMLNCLTYHDFDINDLIFSISDYLNYPIDIASIVENILVTLQNNVENE